MSVGADAVPVDAGSRGAGASVAPFGAYPPGLLQSIASAIGRRLPPTWAGRRTSSFLRSLLRRTTHRPVDMTVLGQRMRLRVQDNACERRLLVTPQFFDPRELEALRAVVKPGFQFVDLGANVGAFSIFVGVLAKGDARILAIEPQGVLVERLRENIALNGLDVAIAPVAVSDHEGWMEFSVDLHNRGRTSLNLDRNGPWERRVERLPVRTLLSLVREHGFTRIDALKADIEGAEDLAILPLIEEAPRDIWPQLLIMENNAEEWRRDCIKELLARGYTMQLASPGNVILRLNG
jgi:FkbM family methyltransferase